MSILVSGGAGYIGSHTVLALNDRGQDVVVLDDLSTGFSSVVPDGVPLIVGSCDDEELVTRVIQEHGVEAVIHFAGSIVVPDSVSDPLAYYLNNTSRSRSLISAAVRGDVKAFIFSSTAAVYGNGDGGLLDENAPLDPASPYGASKLMTERMLADASKAYGFGYAALRYFNVAGADPRGRAGQSTARATHLIKIAAQAAVGKRNHIECFGQDYPTHDGTCVRDYIHVSDLAQVHVLALDHLIAGGDNVVANCGYGRGASVLEVIEAVKQAAGVDFPVHDAPRRPGDPPSLVADPTRAQNVLGWRAAYDDLGTIVEHALAWERHLQVQAS